MKVQNILYPEPKFSEMSNSDITVDVMEFINDTLVIQTSLNKSTGGLRVISYDQNQKIAEKSSDKDTFAQVVDGIAEIVIGSNTFYLIAGQSIRVPAYSINYVKPFGPCKMVFSGIQINTEEPQRYLKS